MLKKKIVSLIMIGAMIFSLAACGGNKDAEVGNVNGVSITRGEVQQFVDIYAFVQGYDPSAISDENKQSMLTDYVDMEVMKQYLDGKNADIITTSAAAEIENYVTQAHTDSADFLKQYNVQDDELRNFYEKQYYSSAFFSELSEDMQSTDMEKRAQEYYDANKETFKATEDEVRASHIIVDSEELAQQLLDRINAGEDFATLAKENSTDGSASSGGDLGYFKYGDMVEDFSKEAFKLDVDQVSGIVKTTYGYHIIKCTGKRATGEYIPFDDAYSDIYYTLYQEDYNKKMESIKADMKVTVGTM